MLAVGKPSYGVDSLLIIVLKKMHITIVTTSEKYLNVICDIVDQAICTAGIVASVVNTQLYIQGSNKDFCDWNMG